MSTYSLGLVSGILHSVTYNNISVIDPYTYQAPPIGKGVYPVPVISVYCPGDLTAFASELLNPNVGLQLFAIAVPSGITGPSGGLSLISGFVANYPPMLNLGTTRSSIHPSGTTATIIYAYDPNWNPRTSTVRPIISGNAYYDIYATHALVQTNRETFTTASGIINASVIGYSPTCAVISGVLSRAPYPDLLSANQLNIGVTDTGQGSFTGDYPLTQFKFDVGSKLSLFSNQNLFGGGARGLAVSGLLQMYCSGIVTQKFYPSLYDGTNSSITPIYQYSLASGSMTWKVPKYASSIDLNNPVFEGYVFYASYINTSGLLTGPIPIVYTADILEQMNNDTFVSSTTVSIPLDDLDSLTQGPIPIDIGAVGADTGRSRIAIGINDIDLVMAQYNQTGVYISAPYTSTNPIYAISMQTDESAMGFPGYTPKDLIKYYIQLDVTDSGQWYPISPKPRVNESDSNGAAVPNVYILDSNLLASDRITDIYNQVGFITMNKETYNFRIKILIDTSKTGNGGKNTPQVFDYRVSVIDRASLSSNSMERYLFN